MRISDWSSDVCSSDLVLAIQLPVMVVAATVGVWLFSVQHRFEGTAWLRQSDWTAVGAALDGSSYLRLPRLLQWFTGNIGFHHVHHLNPQVPNYRLQDCHEAVPSLRAPLGSASCRERVCQYVEIPV